MKHFPIFYIAANILLIIPFSCLHAQQDVGTAAQAEEAVRRGDYSTAIKIAQPLADRGDKSANYILGELRIRGLGVPKDFQGGFYLLKKNADNGDARSQYEIGDIYLIGKYVKKNEKLSFEYFLLAAKQGMAIAQFKVGTMLNPGIFEGRPAKITILKRQNNSDAADDQDDAVPKDAVASFQWYKVSADQGLAMAQYNLANCYRDGQGVPSNKSESVRYYLMAAKQGFSMAQNNLAAAYANGDGAAKNISRAYAWYSIAASNGETSAMTNRDNLVDRMSPGERARGDKLAAQCLASGFVDCE